MIRIGIIAIAIALFLAGCNGQANQEIAGSKTDSIVPETDIRVNKEYDENGHLIRYDSSYSYYYSNIESDTLVRDSIYRDFQNYFNKRYSFSNEPFFDNLFFEDSLLHYDFYKHDFFSDRFKRNMEDMDQLFWQMDSIKNYFFYEHFPESELETTDSLQKEK